MKNSLGVKTLSILKNSAFSLPKKRPPGDFGDFLEECYRAFFEQLSRFEGPIAESLASRRSEIETLASNLVAAWRVSASGDTESAYRQVAKTLDRMRDSLAEMSRRHTAKILPGQSFYRLAAWKGVQLRKHMFHAPFEMKSKTNYRFSTPDRPTLYLGNSVYLCWLECRRPDPADCFVSRFEVDWSGFEFLDIAGSHELYLAPLDLPEVLDLDPRSVTNSPFVADVTSELVDYLAVWPLFAAVSVEQPTAGVERPAEYLIPQLLMRWASDREGFFGVRYFTSKDDSSSNSQDWPINFAIPARTAKSSGYCDVLQERIRCTLPQSLALMDQKPLRELVTREAGDRRQEALGRVMITEGRTMTPYIESIYGKMEYWLDRPEFPVDRIEAH